MTAAQIASEVTNLVETYAFSKKTTTIRVTGFYVVSFSIRTTTTRAASILTRLNLIMHHVSTPTKKILVKKHLAQLFWPKERSELADWTIMIQIPIKEVVK